MPAERSVYLLDPKDLSPETIAVTFAKTSRSPESFRDIAAELTDEKSAQFHEKWVVGYGHSSVAEHAVLHIAAENISRLAVETLESNRLASYTEKSTRYQKWEPSSFHVPAELDGHPLRERYLDTCRLLFQAYQDSLPALRRVVEDENPRREGESDSAWERRLRSRYVDVARFFLPAASLANVGMTINARALEHAVRKMLSHPLLEVQTIGQEIKQVALANVPTLVKYADEVPYWQQAALMLAQAVQALELPEPAEQDWCRLVDCDPAGEDRVLAAALYRFGSVGGEQLMEHVRLASPQQRKAWADMLLAGCEKYDIPLRETEYLSYTFDLILDQGGFFELKRHRMMTQTPQPLTTLLGYATPKKMITAGLEAQYHEAMRTAEQAYRALSEWNPDAAAYVVPNGYNRRVLLQMNFRSARHLVGLRGATNAHFSLRRVALRIAEEIRACSPLLGDYLPEPGSETWQQVEAENFASV